MNLANRNRTIKIGSLLLLALSVLATVGVANADTIDLRRTFVQDGGKVCVRNNNGTTGIQVTLSDGVCPRTTPAPTMSGPGSSNGPGAPTTGTYTFSLLNSNTPALTLVRVGTTSNFTVAGTIPQFNFTYQEGSTVHVTGTVRFTQFTQTSNSDNAIQATGQFVRTGGTSPQFFSTTGTLIVFFSFGGNETLITLWNNVVPQDPNNPDANWVGRAGGFAVEGELVPDLIPSAAHVDVGGRVLTSTGYGIPRAMVTMSTMNGDRRTAMTNPFGYYTFNDVEVGSIYVISVSAKRYTFPNSTITTTVVDEVTSLDFIAEP